MKDEKDKAVFVFSSFSSLILHPSSFILSLECPSQDLNLVLRTLEPRFGRIVVALISLLA
jgi:hypothetical protein